MLNQPANLATQTVTVVDLTETAPRTPVDLTGRREGRWATTPTGELLDLVTEALDDLEFSAELAWDRLAWADVAISMVLARTGPDPDALDDEGLLVWNRAQLLLGRVETHRQSLAALESDDAFAARCAVALACLDGAPVGANAADLDAHIPDFAADNLGFRQWRAARLQGLSPQAAHPELDATVDTIHEDRGVRAVLIVDWSEQVISQHSASWTLQLVTAAVGRYGTFVAVSAPRDVVTVVPAIVGRFLLAATLGTSAVRCSAVVADHTDALVAVAEHLELTGDRPNRALLVHDASAAAESMALAGMVHTTLPR